MRRRQCVQASPTPATTLQPAPKERGLPPPYSTRVPGQDERTGLATSSGRELAVDTGLQGARNNDSEGVHEYKPVVAVKVAGAVAVHPRDEARRGVPHGLKAQPNVTTNPTTRQRARGTEANVVRAKMRVKMRVLQESQTHPALHVKINGKEHE